MYELQRFVTSNFNFSTYAFEGRQIEILKGLLIEKDRELADIKSKIAEAMALHMIPTTSACMNGIDTDSVMTSPLYSNKQQREDGIVKSNLNPHASDYTPKNTM